ncbi:thiol oxidoreductase [Myxococcota bacterium]|nr:thiol oxidoreductase [Myxococcota bacterium]
MHQRIFQKQNDGSIRVLRWTLLVLACGVVFSCHQVSNDSPEPKPGGMLTQTRFADLSLADRSKALSPAIRADFSIGHSFAKNPWVTAPASTTARDGLGPLFNARSCLTCHTRAGRGVEPESEDARDLALLYRVSLPGQDSKKGVVPDPVYGDQIQVSSAGMGRSFSAASLAEGRWGEARPELEYQWTEGQYADGEVYTLRKPVVRLVDLAYGEPSQDLKISARLASPLIGMGLIEAIPAESILQRADPDDQDQDGISGKANRVWDRERGRTVLGRYGWKAGQPSLKQQVAAAFRNDIGITNILYPDEACTENQQDCLEAPSGQSSVTGVELEKAILPSVVEYVRGLAVPARSELVGREWVNGRKHFSELRCADCHTPVHRTGSADHPWLSDQEISPYSDFLLHDMGPDLADDRPEFLANGREWRTPPLWGLRVAEAAQYGAPRYLHDGRARSLSEAILWHGGEAEYSRQGFRSLERDQRHELINFLRSL